MEKLEKEITKQKNIIKFLMRGRREGVGDKNGQKKRTPGSLYNSKYAPCTSELSEVYFTRLAVTEDYKVARGRMTDE